jgi:hypothetical protein
VSEWLILTAKIAAVWLVAAFVFALIVGRLMAGEPIKKKGGHRCPRTF